MYNEKYPAFKGFHKTIKLLGDQDTNIIFEA
jgi:hypothetical protein